MKPQHTQPDASSKGRSSPLRTLTLALLLANASVAAAEPSILDLKRMSVEELMNVSVYSASRYLEPVQGSPSAIFVLSGEDLRRSHATSIPEALRLVPGVQVARVDANKWAVSMRGFNSREANKLLVLMDGRSIYDPLFSGTLWESQDVMLEDVERIEVIRGPGGTLWGANAFNGIINIITRSAADTQGGIAVVSGGNEEHYTAAGRYGWRIGEQQQARVYVKAYGRDEGYLDSAPPDDAARMLRGGFRWDWAGNGSDTLRLSGDLFNAHAGIRESPIQVQDVHHQGRNVLARWNRQLAGNGGLQLQLYYDHVDYDSFGFTQRRDTYDLQFQQSVRATSRHFVVWGGGLRLMRDQTKSGLAGLVDVLPLGRDDETKDIFVQDTIDLLPETLHLIAGLKYENTDYAPEAWLPNLRLAFTPNASQTWWAAVSEATRVPSRLESDLTFFGTIRPGDGFGAEQVRAFELGHRQLLSPEVGYDVALFYNDYDDLRTSEPSGVVRNLMGGSTYGAELALRWEPGPRWRLDAAYTYLQMDLSLDAASRSNPGTLRYIEGLAAGHQVTLHSLLDLTANLDFDATLRYVDSLPSIGIAAYTELDLALAWRPHPALELTIAGQNLLHDHHPEQAFAFSATGMRTETQRGAYARMAWQF